MVNEREIYIYVYVYLSTTDEERLPGNGQLMALCKSRQTPCGSAWAWNQNTSFLSISQHADGWHTTCEEKKGLCGPCDMPSKKKKPTPQPGRGRRGKASMRYREAMSSWCWEANSQRVGERGHLCPCRLDYRGATRPVTQCVKARVISRTDNWTLILVDIVVGMICQADRAYVLTSADRLQTKGMFGRSDLGLRCHRARDDTAISHELPSWAPFPKNSGQVPGFGGRDIVCKTTSTPIYACTPLPA